MNKPAPKCFYCFKECYAKYRIVHLAILFAASLLIPEINIAQSIGNWTFNSVLTGTPGIYNTVSTADFSSSVPIHSFNGGTEYYGENGWPAGSINTAMYMEFSLTPNAGYQLDISSLVLTIRRSNTGSPAGSGPTSWSLRSSLDGFATDITSGSMTLTYANYTVTPGSSFLNLYTTVTFRLYGYNASISSGGNSRFVVDNITVNGIGYLLPVTLEDLHAFLQNEKVNLSYNVYNTQKKSRYFIERSTDGIHYTTIHETEEENNAKEGLYTYTDDIQSLNDVPQLYYRVYMQSSSGVAYYSPSVLIKKKINTTQIKTFIKSNQLYINGMFTSDASYKAIIYSTNGQVLISLSFNASTGYNSFILDLNKKTPSISILKLVNNRGYSSAVFLTQRP